MIQIFKHIIFFFVICSYGQNITTTLNKKIIKIGAPAILSLKTQVHSSDYVLFPELDSIGKIEVIENKIVDTIKENGKTFLVKNYIVTQFDQGNYQIPEVEVLYNNKKIKSTIQNLDVQDVAVDTTKQPMYDIKADENIDESFEENTSEFNGWYLITSLLIVVLFTILIYWIVKKWLTHTENKREKYIPPFDKFQQQLIQLEQEQNDNKNYYSKLIQAFKSYFETTLEIPALESTTEDFLLFLQAKNDVLKWQDNTTLNEVETLLKRADLVKFAKISVDELQIQADKGFIKNLIEKIHTVLPKSKEEFQIALALEQDKKIQLRNKNIKQASVLIAFLLSISSCVYYLGFENIQDYFHEKINGKDCYYYNKKQWLTSEYGYPVLQIETPEVLQRNSNPTKGFQIKNYAQFEWNKLADEIAIQVETTAFKDSIVFDLKNQVNIEIEKLKKQGAQNITFDLKKFKNQNLEGDEMKGIYEIENKKHNYKILIFHNKKSQHVIRISALVTDKDFNSFNNRLIENLKIIQPEDE